MKGFNPLTAFGIAVALAMAANAALAAPLNPGSEAIVGANAALNDVERVHGTHRVCVRGWVPRWGVARRHRHVGVARLPVRC
jgi:hypothetical protein